MAANNRNGNGLGDVVFTTGQVAKICHTSCWTVGKWFDSGRLQGYRLPDSNDRRVRREDLVAFLRDHGMTREAEALQHRHRVLTLGLRHELATVGEHLPADLRVLDAAQAVEAGSLWQEHRPEVVVIDWHVGQVEACATARWLSHREPRPHLVGIVGDEGIPFSELPAYLRDYGWNKLLQAPAPEELAEVILEFLEGKKS